MNENIVRATHDTSFLVKDLRAAHADACQNNPLLEILLLDLIGHAVEIENKLARIGLALEAPQE